MILKTLTPLKYGPFSHAPTIEFEDDVTVLTGPNDTGKTSVLKLIWRICSSGADVAEDEFNTDSVSAFSKGLDIRHEIGALAVFKMTPESVARFLPDVENYVVDE